MRGNARLRVVAQDHANSRENGVTRMWNARCPNSDRIMQHSEFGKYGQIGETA